ncbi:hypothetical protein KDI_43320 [Dictyobacter arantiisoli]|uniref:PsbP C-terminal domain-containing protein n=2 Tax=Dictyobacter arantiisoli TaxID=2014874 RepID=A0A5A5THT0_9CHLR|nr:hypothetical protein KDI_43320 [Dictyobacter arantiisoli]
MFCGYCGSAATPPTTEEQLSFPPTPNMPAYYATGTFNPDPHPTPPPTADQSYLSQSALTQPRLFAQSGQFTPRPTGTISAAQPEQPSLLTAASSEQSDFHQSDFHQGETEAIMMPASSPQMGYAGAYGHTPNAPAANLPYPLTPYPNQHNYGIASQPQLPYYPAGQQQRRVPQSSTILILCICLLVVAISTISILAFTMSHGSSPEKTHTGPTGSATPHTQPTVAPTAIPSPTALSPTPTAIPTPVPDAGFVYCGVECAPSGFMDEYPQGWQLSVPAGVVGMQFVNPQQPVQTVLFKSADNPTGASATALLANELQASYASKPGFQAPNPPTGQAVTIGGETWTAVGILYQGDNQQAVQVTVCTTVHQGKLFILEFQASQDQFAQVSTAYYNIMIGKFQFTNSNTNPAVG